jgi:hypothetical protein
LIEKHLDVCTRVHSFGGSKTIQNPAKRTEGMSYQSSWTPERRARQAAIIRCTKPWTRSTGPRTPEGKAISSKNAAHGSPDHQIIIAALEMLVRSPPQEVADQLWAQIEAAGGGPDWDAMDRELATPWPDDEVLFDIPIDGDDDDDEGALDRFFPVDP